MDSRWHAFLYFIFKGKYGMHSLIFILYVSFFDSKNFPLPLIFACLILKFAQIAKALQFVHGRGIAHLDVKPDNIYIKNGVYKLGDFGCATLIDKSLPIEEGDARYMPQEILNEKYDHLDKVDIFSLGAAIYELIRGSPLPESGSQFLKEGKLPLLPGHSLQFQNLLKVQFFPLRQ